MSISKPYYLTIRPFTDGDYPEGRRSRFIKHPKYATEPAKYVRAFTMIQKDIINLFEYVEPAEKNLGTYSFRTFELLLRTCTEVEANFKAILRANTYNNKSEDWNMKNDYSKIQRTHFLSDYRVRLPFWTGRGGVVQPFKKWASGYKTLDWYGSYNGSKHDRNAKLDQANLKNLIGAFTGLAVLLAAQYYTYDFSANDVFLTEPNSDKFKVGIGGYICVKFPGRVRPAERYNFDWSILESESAPFQKIDYNKVPSLKIV